MNRKVFGIFTFMRYSVRQQSSKARKPDKSKIKVKHFSEIPQPNRLPVLATVLDYTRFRNFDPFRIHHFIGKRHKALGPIYKENIFPGVTRPTVYTLKLCFVPRVKALVDRL